MKLAITCSLLLASVFCAPIARAGITGITFQPDGDGNITCLNPNVLVSADQFSADIRMTGDLWAAPAHMLGTVTANSDPTITLYNSINNDTGYAWTSFIVNVYMGQSFTLGPIHVTAPADWSITASPIVDNTNPAFFSGTGKMGTFTLYSGTPVNPGGHLDFDYAITFTGSMSFAEEMIPVPEPSSLAVLLLGSFLFFRRPLRRV